MMRRNAYTSRRPSSASIDACGPQPLPGRPRVRTVPAASSGPTLRFVVALVVVEHRDCELSPRIVPTVNREGQLIDAHVTCRGGGDRNEPPTQANTSERATHPGRGNRIGQPTWVDGFPVRVPNPVLANLSSTWPGSDPAGPRRMCVLPSPPPGMNPSGSPDRSPARPPRRRSHCLRLPMHWR